MASSKLYHHQSWHGMTSSVKAEVFVLMLVFILMLVLLVVRWCAVRIRREGQRTCKAGRKERGSTSIRGASDDTIARSREARSLPRLTLYPNTQDSPLIFMRFSITGTKSLTPHETRPHVTSRHGTTKHGNTSHSNTPGSSFTMYLGVRP